MRATRPATHVQECAPSARRDMRAHGPAGGPAGIEPPARPPGRQPNADALAPRDVGDDGKEGGHSPPPLAAMAVATKATAIPQAGARTRHTWPRAVPCDSGRGGGARRGRRMGRRGHGRQKRGSVLFRRSAGDGGGGEQAGGLLTRRRQGVGNTISEPRRRVAGATKARKRHRRRRRHGAPRSAGGKGGGDGRPEGRLSARPPHRHPSDPAAHGRAYAWQGVPQLGAWVKCVGQFGCFCSTCVGVDCPPRGGTIVIVWQSGRIGMAALKTQARQEASWFCLTPHLDTTSVARLGPAFGLDPLTSPGALEPPKSTPSRRQGAWSKLCQE